MKRIILSSILLVLLSFNLYAECQDVYSSQIERLATELKAQHRAVNKNILGVILFGTTGLALGTGLGVEAIEISSTGTLAAEIGSFATLALVPFAFGGFFLGILLADNLSEIPTPMISDQIYHLRHAHQFLKEAEAGEGAMILQSMNTVWAQLGNSVAPRQVADAIAELNQDNVFCKEDNNLATADGILQMAIEKLKTAQD